MTVNGAPVAADVEDRTLLVHFLRETAGLTATNIGCDTTSCGACTVLLDGESVKSCTVLAAQADGRQVTTVEGLAGPGGELHPMQRAFRAEHGLQCGFCTPGMVLASVSLLRENPHPTEAGGPGRAGGQPVPVHRLPQHRPRGPGRGRGGPVRGQAPDDPRTFTYQRAASVAEALELVRRVRRRRQVPGRRAFAAAADETAAGPAGGAHRPGAGAGAELHPRRGRAHRDRGADPPPRPGALRLLARSVPLLAHAAGQVGDPQVRHRGTIGGSLAHSDPASDLPATVLALDATLVARGPSGVREIAAADFFQGLFETALEPDELLTEIRVPVPAPGAAGWSFQKFTKRAIDWAIVGVAVQGRAVALVNMAGTPVRAAGVERPWPTGPRPPRPRPTPPRAPARPMTSTPARLIVSISPGSSWSGRWSKHRLGTAVKHRPGQGFNAQENHERSHHPAVPCRPRGQPAPARRAARGPGGFRGRAHPGGATAGHRGRRDRRRGQDAGERGPAVGHRRRVPPRVLAHGLHLPAGRDRPGAGKPAGQVPQPGRGH